ncbi:MAG: hypothetical protein IJ725_00920 [Ruminococcus sp.]|nr:hypothetical protein [Ruminococcus sp.]
MKRIVSIAVIAVLCMSMLLTACTGTYDKAPDEYTKIRWAAPDYSFTIYPDNDCTGIYKFQDTTYNIKVEFEGAASLTVRDTGNKDTRLFVADWMYDDGDLYIYNIQFNTKDYKAFKENYAEYVTLGKEKV